MAKHTIIAWQWTDHVPLVSQSLVQKGNLGSSEQNWNFSELEKKRIQYIFNAYIE